MVRPPLDREKESRIVGEYPIYPSSPTPTAVPVYDTPITPAENYRILLEGKEPPLWTPASRDMIRISPKLIADNPARGGIMDAETLAPEERGGRDMFGVEWVFVPMVGGSMVKPGCPKVPDISRWEEYITFPDLSKLDWEKSGKGIRSLLTCNRMHQCVIVNGLFERLISFMDFEGAAMALLDEDQQEGVHRLFDKLADLYDEMIGRFQRYYGIEIMQFHDDWGSQRAPFFSEATCREMIFPYLKRVVDSCHKRGLFFDFHCCGKNEPLVPLMIEAGVDMWTPQPMNNIEMLLENYNDKLVLGLYPPDLDPGLDDGTIRDIAWRFVADRIKTPRFTAVSGAAHMRNPAAQKFLREVYFASREQFSKL